MTARLVLLQTVVPLASDAFHIEGRRPNLLIVRHSVGAEELLRLMQPVEGILGAVTLGETELVSWRRRGTSLVVVA